MLTWLCMVLLTIQWSILWSPSCQTWTQSCDYCYSYEIEIFTFIYSTSKATNEWVIDCQQPGSFPRSLLATPLDSTVWKCTCYYDISGYYTGKYKCCNTWVLHLFISTAATCPLRNLQIWRHLIINFKVILLQKRTCQCDCLPRPQLL